MAVAAWWAKMSVTARRAYIRKHPNSIYARGMASGRVAQKPAAPPPRMPVRTGKDKNGKFVEYNLNDHAKAYQATKHPGDRAEHKKFIEKHSKMKIKDFVALPESQRRGFRGKVHY